MILSLAIPDELACELSADPSRAVLEFLLAELYRIDKVGKAQIRKVLGFSSWYDVEDFMRRYRLDEYRVEDLREDLAYLASHAEDAKANAA